MRCMLTMHISLTELPEEPDAPLPGADPIAEMAKVATGLLGRVPIAIPQPPGGIELRRSAEVRALDFKALAEILGRYDALTRDLQMDYANLKL